MNLARTQTNKETRRQEEEILDRIIPTEIVDLNKVFDEEDEEEMDNLSECQPYDHAKDQEEDFTSDCRVYSLSFPELEKPDKFIDEDMEKEDIQPLKPLKPSYRDHWRQDE